MVHYLRGSMPPNTVKPYKWIVAGFAFAALWASASTATKIGLVSAQPLVIAVTRFALAAVIMLFIAHALRRKRLPQGHEWKQLAIYGALNVAIYLGCYIIAMQTITAGIGALAVATNPVFISFLSVIFLKKKLTPPLIASIIICMAGVVCAAWPLFYSAAVTVSGLLILLFSMFSYSVAAIYFSAKKWDGLDLFTINGWQTFIGGVLLFPVALFLYKKDLNHFDKTFWGSVCWLAIPVSIFAVQVWLWLLRANPVKAGLWLFLCPLFGFSYAAWLMKEPLTIYTVIGVLLVISGLLLSGISAKKNKVVFD